MSCPFLGVRKVRDAVIAVGSQLGAKEGELGRPTFVSTNLFIVARIS